MMKGGALVLLAAACAHAAEQSFEWAGIFDTDAGSYTLTLQAASSGGTDYAARTMTIVVLPADDAEDATLHGLESDAEDGFGHTPCTPIQPGGTLTPATHKCYELQICVLMCSDTAEFTIVTSSAMAIFMEHHPAEFERDTHYLMAGFGTYEDIDPVHEFDESTLTDEERAALHGHDDHEDHDDHDHDDHEDHEDHDDHDHHHAEHGDDDDYCEVYCAHYRRNRRLLFGSVPCDCDHDDHDDHDEHADYHDRYPWDHGEGDKVHDDHWVEEHGDDHEHDDHIYFTPDDCYSDCTVMQDDCTQSATDEYCLSAMSEHLFPFAQLAGAEHFDCDVACTGEHH